MTAVLSSYLSPEQVELLLKPIHPQRVLSLKNMAYVAGHDIRAELNRIFGFGRWDQELLRQDLICDREVKTKAGSNAFYVLYRSTVRLSVRTADGTPLCFYDGTHVGESTHPVQGDAHGNAVTNSETYALRRAAINLGDQFGLSLYNKGSLEPIVRWTLIGVNRDEPANTDDVLKVEAEDIPEPVTGNPPETSAEIPQEKTQESPGKTPRTRKKLEPEPPATLEALVKDIAGAGTIEDLRTAWKHAGNMGKLQEEITLTQDGKKTKTTVQAFLFARSDELGIPKSTDSSPGDPGSADGDQ